ncbi:MAG: TonB-dependent receptor domain-containing protein [Bacteroidia bacterium]
MYFVLLPSRTLLLLFLFLSAFFSMRLIAQQPLPKGSGRISGKVVDSLNAQAVEYATISLVTQDDKKVVNGGTTDDKGVFKLDGIPDGNYRLLVYFIGYQTATLNNITISKNASTVSLGNIRLVNRQTMLKEVTVEAEKSLIENKIDKLVYNADKDVTSQGGVATDILKKVPQVAVDADGNVELQGNSNIRFLINGKPSGIFGSNIADVLQSIPASQIQSIEVITSPGARYDAEGTGGIINIILKKSTAQGINGNVSVTAATRLENGSLNLSARKGKFGMSAFLSGNGQLPSVTLNTLDRESQTTKLLQSGQTNFSRAGAQTGLGFDWSLNAKNSLSGGVNYNYFLNSSTGSSNRQSITTDSSGTTLSDISNLLNSQNNFHSNTIDWNLNYKKTFAKEDQELDVLYNAYNTMNYNYYLQTQKFVAPDSLFAGSNGKNPGTDMQHNIAINYTQPLGKSVSFETGLKTVLGQLNSKSDVYLLNPYTGDYNYSSAQSSQIDYRRNIFAGYVSTTIKTKVLDVKAGCRYEYTDTKAAFSNSGNVPLKPYGIFIPSAIVSHTFKNNHSLKFSYSYRIQRPDYRDLNPFVNASDPRNLTTGNPSLTPETTHNFELGYNSYFKKGTSLNVALFARNNYDDIQAYTYYYSSYKVGDSTYKNVSVTTRENIGKEYNFGLNVYFSLPVKSKLNLRSNISAFQRYIINKIDPGLDISGFNYRVNLTASYQITPTFIAEVFGNFNSPRINAQGKQPSFTTYNIAIRKQFFNKKASIAFTATNPFNKYISQKTETTGTNFTLNSLRQLPYRSFGINITYKFGKLEFKKEKAPEDVNLTNPGQGN